MEYIIFIQHNRSVSNGAIAAALYSGMYVDLEIQDGVGGWVGCSLMR